MAGTELPETAVPADVRARLPATSPPPPWRLPARAVLWLSRGAAPGVRGLPLTVGAVVDYRDSPVGPYREVFAGSLLRQVGLPAVHVPFIAVDSLPSLRAGRVHWGLPKAVAGFTGSVGERVRAAGGGWAVEVAARPYGPVLPAAGLVVAVQDGLRTLVTVRGTARLARVAAGWATAGTPASSSTATWWSAPPERWPPRRHERSVPGSLRHLVATVTGEAGPAVPGRSEQISTFLD